MVAKPPEKYKLIQHSAKSVGSGLNYEMALFDKEGFGEDGRDEWRVLSSIGASPRLWVHKPPLGPRFALASNSTPVGLLLPTIG